MSVDLNALERLAERATPGPWRWDAETLRGRHRNAIFYPRQPHTPRDLVNRDEDAQFIAACDPATVTALVRAVRALEAATAFRNVAALNEAAAALAPFRESA